MSAAVKTFSPEELLKGQTTLTQRTQLFINTVVKASYALGDPHSDRYLPEKLTAALMAHSATEAHGIVMHVKRYAARYGLILPEARNSLENCEKMVRGVPVHTLPSGVSNALSATR